MTLEEWLDAASEVLDEIETNKEDYLKNTKWLALARRIRVLSGGNNGEEEMLFRQEEGCTSMRQPQSPSTRTSLQEQEKKVLMEIVETEITYVNCLDVLVNSYRHPLFEAEYGVNGKILSLEKVYRIFSNLEDLLVVNTELLEQLRTRIVEEESRRIGDIFLNMSFALKIYSRYIIDYDAARSTLADSLESNQKFAAFVEKTQEETAPKCKGQKLESLMIMPVQRIPRYELLLRELLKVRRKLDLSNSQYNDELEQCMDSIREVAEANNERIRATETKAVLYDIQKKFIPKLQYPLVGPGVPQRHLIREGTMRKVHGRGGNQVECRMILLSDCLLYAIEKSQNKLELHRRIELADPTTSFNEYNNTNTSVSTGSGFSSEGNDVSSSKMIAMINSDKSMICVCESVKDRDEWLAALQTATSRAQSNVFELDSRGDDDDDLDSPLGRPTSTVAPTNKVAMSIWEQDTPQCTVTRIKFTVMTRRHHCRVNGECVSAQASKARFNLKELGNRFESSERVCDLCCRDLTLLNNNWAQVISCRDKLRKQISLIANNPQEAASIIDPLLNQADPKHGVVFGSWLWKKGGAGSFESKSRSGPLGRRNWKKRWCELRRFESCFELLYFDEPGIDFELYRGRVSLRGASMRISDPTNYLMFIITALEGRDYPIRILDDAQPLPPSDQEKGLFALWKYALSQAIQKSDIAIRPSMPSFVLSPANNKNKKDIDTENSNLSPPTEDSETLSSHKPPPPPPPTEFENKTHESLAAWRIQRIRQSSDWYWQNAAGEQCGPSSFIELKQAYASNNLLDTCHVYSDAITDGWKLLDSATHLKIALTSP